MKKYQKFVFDLKNKRFIGDFETMYQKEEVDHFDSWGQDDDRQLQRLIIQDIFSLYNFDLIIDLGCGKGTLTHKLKKANNKVIGIDISKTAIKIAKAKYPDIIWYTGNLVDNKFLKKFFNIVNKLNDESKVTLTFCSEILSYLKNWEQIISYSSKYSNYLLISTYIPPNPLGFVKDPNKLIEIIKESYNVIEIITLNMLENYIIFAESKKWR